MTPPTTAPTGPAIAPTTAPVAAPAAGLVMGGMWIFLEVFVADVFDVFGHNFLKFEARHSCFRLKD